MNTIPKPLTKVIYCEKDKIINYLPDAQSCILVMDEAVVTNINDLNCYRIIIIKANEANKSLSKAEEICKTLLSMGAHRNITLVGIGGGIVTDITGFVASVFMRGIPFVFIPTTLLGMVDAAIGGKNGVNLELHKNMIGAISQPSCIIYAPSLLNTLPDKEWANGFAEVIKYACLFDAELYAELNCNNIAYYQNNKTSLENLISRCFSLKDKIVATDERDEGIRRQLNFGHTAGHAIETLYKLPHGYAVGIGMLIACYFSEQILNTDVKLRKQLSALLSRYKLPTALDINVDVVMGLIGADKKKDKNTISYILLKQPGTPVIRSLSIEHIQHLLNKFVYESNY